MDPTHAACSAPSSDEDDLVKLNVGGRRFITRRSTLSQPPVAQSHTSQSGQSHIGNFFSGLLSGRFPVVKDEKGFVFVDRNPDYFEVILDYLRSGEWECPPHLSTHRLKKEALYYGVILTPPRRAKKGRPDITDEALEKLLATTAEIEKMRTYEANQARIEELEEIIFDAFYEAAAARSTSKLGVTFIFARKESVLELLSNHLHPAARLMTERILGECLTKFIGNDHRIEWVGELEPSRYDPITQCLEWDLHENHNLSVRVSKRFLLHHENVISVHYEQLRHFSTIALGAFVEWCPPNKPN